MLSGNAPFTDVQLLWVNLIVDTLGTLALASETPNDDLMKRVPFGKEGKFISNAIWRNIVGQFLYQFSLIWFLQTRGRAALQLNGPDSDLILNTLIFNSFVFCQVIFWFLGFDFIKQQAFYLISPLLPTFLNSNKNQNLTLIGSLDLRHLSLVKTNKD